MNKYNIRLQNNKVIGPFDLNQIKELIDSGRATVDNYFKLFPVGSWEPGASIQEIRDLGKASKKETLEEFQYEKKEQAESNDSREDSKENLSDEGIDEEATVILNTQKFRKLDDKTKVINVENLNLNDHENDEIPAKNPEDEEEKEEEKTISSSDATTILSLDDVKKELLGESLVAEEQLKKSLEVKSSDREFEKSSRTKR